MEAIDHVVIGLRRALGELMMLEQRYPADHSAALQPYVGNAHAHIVAAMQELEAIKGD